MTDVYGTALTTIRAGAPGLSDATCEVIARTIARKLKASDTSPILQAGVPPRGPGHCDDDAAWAEFARQYEGRPRSRPDITDFALANRVFMADRSDLDLIVWQTAAKERIRWLSLALAQAASKARSERDAHSERAPTPNPISTAPRDGKMLRLWVRYPEGGSWTPLDDARESWTIGFNNFENTQDDRWQVVGWCWSHDHFVEAADDVEVLGWLPFHSDVAAALLPSEVEA